MKSAPPSSLLDLEQYAEGTSSQLLYLQVQCSPCTIAVWCYPMSLPQRRAHHVLGTCGLTP